MGAQNSRSSFKNNSSINANDPNAMASEQFSFNNSKNKSINKDVDILTKFTWNYGGSTVLLTGSFNRWKQTIPLQKQGEQFSITILLPRGLHYYKFIVDGEWRFSPQDPSIPDANGNINNYIDTTNYYPLMQNKKSEYSGPVFNQNNQKNRVQVQVPKGAQQFPKIAPILPIHYEDCQYLNDSIPKLGEHQTLNQMMDIQNQQGQAFQLSLTQDQLKSIFNSCHCLAPPTHVTVDHIVRQVTKDYQEIAITQRFKAKYTTYRYYS